MIGQDVEFFVCACGETHHHLHLGYWINEEDSKVDYNEIYLTFCADRNGTFWERVKNAFKFVFCGGELIVSDIVWEKETTDKFVKALKRIPWAKTRKQIKGQYQNVYW